MKILNLILAALFFVFASVQLNDDPDDIWFWVIVYAGVGIISAFAAFNRYNMWVIVLGIGVVLYQMFRMFPGFLSWLNSGTPSIVGDMQATSPYIEIVREFLGLLLCLFVLIYHYIQYARIKKSIKDESLLTE